ncbi:hypothetical protein LJC36_04190, partial [Desulfovibrio sp. OttesenSCG-928-C14]|nr:hypothetical protein [Desulfovibrio sp. OttesenSCG-928-C14]
GGRGAAIGAGIGALVGGVTGYFVGDHIAKKKADYATEEEWLDACIAQARQLNTEAAQYNAQLKKDIAELDKESAKLAADYKANKASRSALQAEAESIEKRRKEVAANIDILENEVNNQKAVAQDARDNNKNAEAKAVEAEIAAMEKKIVEMRDYNNKLASISVRVAV